MEESKQPTSSLSWVLDERHVSDSDRRYRLVKTQCDVPELLEGQVLVRVLYAALNRRDHWIRLGLYPGISFPAVLGADCYGEVVNVGDLKSHGQWLNKRVVLNAGVAWGPHERAPDAMFHLLGMVPAGGTLGQYLVAQAEQLYHAPSHLTGPQAAALPLAGLTAYRATITKAQITAGQRVLVTGIGGGVAVFCMQFALAAGASVWVTSSSNAKIDRAVELGASGGVNYRDKDWVQKLRAAVPQRFDAVIDGAGGDSLSAYVSLLRVGGIISMYGATTGRPRNLNVTQLFLKNVELRGSTMGSPREFEAMLRLVAKSGIVPVVSRIHDFDDALAAFNTLQASTQFGKVVVRVCASGLVASRDASSAPGVVGTPLSKL